MVVAVLDRLAFFFLGALFGLIAGAYAIAGRLP